MKDIQIGMMGLGTVGSGVLKMIQDNEGKIVNITGCRLHVKTIVVHNTHKRRSVPLWDTYLTDNFDELLHDPDIPIVVEVMGGIHPAKERIAALLKAKKHVVTANKNLIATDGPELTKLAADNGVDLVYEASVAGGIPILRTITNSFPADKILEVRGIVNGTTNYILTKMNDNHLSYQQALKQAQDLGFAEADPTNDVAGFDAAYKMIILSQFSFGTRLTIDDLHVEGIENITSDDIKQADSFGYVIKLIGIARRVKESVFAEVAPVLVPKGTPLATVSNERNAVMVTGQAVGDVLFYGPGAGGLPTANSVLSDIIAVTQNIATGTTGHQFNNYRQQYQPASPDDVRYRYYLSLTMKDVPGEMLHLTKIFADVSASFQTIVQTATADGFARLAIITHQLSQRQLRELQAAVQPSPNNSLKLNAAYKVLEK